MSRRKTGNFGAILQPFLKLRNFFNPQPKQDQIISFESPSASIKRKYGLMVGKKDQKRLEAAEVASQRFEQDLSFYSEQLQRKAPPIEVEEEEESSRLQWNNRSLKPAASEKHLRRHLSIKSPARPATPGLLALPKPLGRSRSAKGTSDTSSTPSPEPKPPGRRGSSLVAKFGRRRLSRRESSPAVERKTELLMDYPRPFYLTAKPSPSPESGSVFFTPKPYYDGAERLAYPKPLARSRSARQSTLPSTSRPPPKPKGAAKRSASLIPGKGKAKNFLNRRVSSPAFRARQTSCGRQIPIIAYHGPTERCKSFNTHLPSGEKGKERSDSRRKRMGNVKYTTFA